jgi:hypothetical protein
MKALVVVVICFASMIGRVVCMIASPVLLVRACIWFVRGEPSFAWHDLVLALVYFCLIWVCGYVFKKINPVGDLSSIRS